jgi:hypothetical protein
MSSLIKGQNCIILLLTDTAKLLAPACETCSTNERNGESVQVLGIKTSKEETTWVTWI